MIINVLSADGLVDNFLRSYAHIGMSDDADIPHVMISYQWGSQTTMLAVKERLKAEGYKVWMDVDNMRM